MIRIRSPRVPAPLLTAALAALACAAPQPETPAVEVPGDTGEQTGVLSSTGYLRWEDLSVRLVGEGPTAGLRIDITTLDPDAVRLAADDIRGYLGDQRARIAEHVPGDEAERLTAFLVGYTGFEKEVGFDPTRLQLRVEGSTYYPRTVIPVSARFDRRVLDLYETVYGIYLFPAGIDLDATLEFQYGELSSGAAWRDVVRRVQRARTRRQGDT